MQHAHGAVHHVGFGSASALEKDDGFGRGVHLLEGAVGELQEIADRGAGPINAFHEFAGEVLAEVGDGGGGDEVEAAGPGAGEADHGVEQVARGGGGEEGGELRARGQGGAAVGILADELEGGEVAGEGTDEANEGGVFFGEGEFDEFVAFVEQALEEGGAVGFSRSEGGGGGGG